MVVKAANTKKPKFGIDAFLPMLLSCGPVCMFIGFHDAFTGAPGTHDSFALSFEVVGILMLAFGLILLKIKQDRIERRLDELERMKS